MFTNTIKRFLNICIVNDFIYIYHRKNSNIVFVFLKKKFYFKDENNNMIFFVVHLLQVPTTFTNITNPVAK